MTVRKMIKELLEYPMDSQVVDTTGSPIMYMLFHCRANTNVRLEPMSQIDKNEWLTEFFHSAEEENTSDWDAVDELKEQGFTLEDLKTYNEGVYEWAKQYW